MLRLSSFFLMMLLPLSGCSGLDFSHLSPDAASFHPKRIAVFPETVGTHESARDVVKGTIKKILNEKGWYDDIVDTGRIKNKSQHPSELSKQLHVYIEQVNSLGRIDPEISRELGRALKADAFFLSDVTSWGYGRLEGNKVCRVALGVKLIDAENGTVIWKANHELIEDYWVIKPTLNDVADELLTKIIKEMPH